MAEPRRNRPPAGTVRLRLLFNADWGSVGWWTQAPITASVDNLQTLAEGVANAWAESILADQTAACSLIESSARLWRDTDEIEGVYTTDAAGGSGSDYLPSSIAAVLSWKIPSVYRGGKPRTYVPGIPVSAQNDERTFEPDFVSAIGGFAVSFLDAVNALTIASMAVSLGTMAFFRGNAALDPPYFESFTDVSAQERICSQRRRLGKLIA